MNEIFLTQGALVSAQPGLVVCGQGSVEKLRSPSNSKDPVFYFPDFFLEDEKPWFVYEKNKILSINKLSNSLSVKERFDKGQWSLTGRDIYSENFFKLKTSFDKGDLKKAVPYLFYKNKQSFKVQLTLPSLLAHSRQHPIFLYGFWEHEEGMLGGTPEALFHIDSNGILTTAAIAGTVKHKDEELLTNDPKLKMEHDLVIEGIRNSLIPFGSVDVGETQILRLSHLSHAKTPITVQLSGSAPLEELIRALHPTPALGAFPKDLGSKWLKEYAKQLPRGRYGAPVGVKIEDHFYCYVAIRNIQWDCGIASLGVGGGVVQASDEQDEITELALKFKATRSMLNI